jgi:hypothetical protein
MEQSSCRAAYSFRSIFGVIYKLCETDTGEIICTLRGTISLKDI